WKKERKEFIKSETNKREHEQRRKLHRRNESTCDWVFDGSAEIFQADFRKMRNDRCGKNPVISAKDIIQHYICQCLNSIVSDLIYAILFTLKPLNDGLFLPTCFFVKLKKPRLHLHIIRLFSQAIFPALPCTVISITAWVVGWMTVLFLRRKLESDELNIFRKTIKRLELHSNRVSSKLLQLDFFQLVNRIKSTNANVKDVTVNTSRGTTEPIIEAPIIEQIPHTEKHATAQPTELHMAEISYPATSLTTFVCRSFDKATLAFANKKSPPKTANLLPRVMSRSESGESTTKFCSSLSTNPL
uniref:Uncharacterized protein n=1 Tax=Romanomermis culicivorax TaxID=13658 RepID=A0A915KHR2_ROMCU